MTTTVQWLLFALFALLLDDGGTYWIIRHGYADADDNPLIAGPARKWGLRTSLLINLTVRALAVAAAWRWCGIEATGLVSVPAAIAGAVNLGNVWLTRRS